MTHCSDGSVSDRISITICFVWRINPYASITTAFNYIASATLWRCGCPQASLRNPSCILPLGWNLVSKGGLNRLVTTGDPLEKVTLAAHPAEPHFYLGFVGASLGQQGRGIGSTLLKSGMTAFDRQGAIAYLESCNIKNNPLYERHGFEVFADATLPDSGPTV
jgi:hypothetical protein